MNTRAESTLGFFIMLIAVIIVATLLSSLLLQNSNYFSEKGLSDGRDNKILSSTSVQVLQIEAEDGSDGNFERLETVLRLGPGSPNIQLDSSFITESTKDTTTNLQFRQNGLPINDIMYGYYTATNHPFTNTSKSFEDEVPTAFRTLFNSPDTSEFMGGKIAVAIIMPESNGSIDNNAENWTQTEQDAMVQASADALNWWSAIEPRAGIRHTFQIYEDVPVSYEPILRGTDATNASLWIEEALDYLGVPDPSPGDTIARTRAMADQLRDDTNAHWAFIAFVVDSSNTGSFADGFAGVAYIQGPYTLIASDGFPGRPEVLMAHEYAHIFGARDEYASSGCTCTDTSGIPPYYNIQTQNCENACLTNTTSIMRAGADSITAYDNNLVSVFTLGQMGLLNTNYNYKIDAVDAIFEADDEDIDLSQAFVNNLSLDGYINPILETTAIGFYVAADASTSEYVDQLERSRMTRIYQETARPLEEEEILQWKLTPRTGLQYVEEVYTPYTITEKKAILER